MFCPSQDYGTLSAWAVWAYLGLYPLTGSPTYILGSPVFANATLAVPSAWESNAAAWGDHDHVAAAPRPVLRMVAHNASDRNIFVSRAAVNGAPLTEPFIDHAILFPTSSPGLLEYW